MIAIRQSRLVTLETSVALSYTSYKKGSLSFNGAVLQAQNARELMAAVTSPVASVSGVVTIICAMMETLQCLVIQSLTDVFAVQTTYYT